MANPYFSFKQFTVYHDLCAMKVGIDAVLLGAWTKVDEAKKILDIGTGTGIIALMLAQRSDAYITAIDIEQSAILQANLNIENSPWKDKISAYETSLQEFTKNRKDYFDLIVSNPPYFANSLKNPDDQRTTARHTDTLTHTELLQNAKQLLSKLGRICIILPIAEGLACVEMAKTIELFCNKIVYVHPKPNTAAKRLLLEFSFNISDTEISSIEIESSERHQYSKEFTALAKDYYLKL